MARDEALEAIDHSQWEVDKMKREIQKLVRNAVESLRTEFMAMISQHGEVPKDNGSALVGVSREA